jgi:hypothetical protein
VFLAGAGRRGIAGEYWVCLMAIASPDQTAPFEKKPGSIAEPRVR